MTRIRASRLLLARAHGNGIKKLQQAIRSTPQGGISYPQGYRHEQTDGWASTERAWQPVYDPAHRPPVGFTPNGRT